MTSQIEIPPHAGQNGNGSGGAAGAAAAAALEGGSYDVIRKRLLEQASELAAKAEALNEKRKKVFGGAELALIANERVRTEHNCIARDIVSVGDGLLFGFQVFLGLKAETKVTDVFAFYRFGKKEGSDEWDLAQLPIDAAGPAAFLADEQFVKECRDTFKYAKDARLLQLKRTDTRLLALVQIGATPRDAKVFRWTIDAANRVTYTDARGDEDAAPPRQHDFEWTQAGREDQVQGPFPHINVLDTVFVETIGGDLTIKVENNTKDGKGIYREPVDDPNQTLDDADVAWAKVGSLILLRIRPFREDAYRYLVFEPRARRVVRIDAIGQACHELPEDHGIVFPGGFYLQTGEYKVFDGATGDLEMERAIKSPNGEDVLYVYHHRDGGEYLLLPYNLIRKEVVSTIRCHGYSLFRDGTMAVFRAVDEPTRVHPLQIWRTPFNTQEHAAAAPRDGSYLAKVGNADLVRGISDALSLRRLATAEHPTRRAYEDLVAAVQRTLDAHYWLGHAEVGDLHAILSSMKKTSELVLDEFDKVEAIENKAREALEKATAAQKDLLLRVRVDDLHVVEDYLRALTTLRGQRGQLITLKDLRGIDVHAVATLEREVQEREGEVNAACVEFFLKDDAWKPLVDRLDAVVTKIETASKATELGPYGEEIDLVHQGLTLLAEVTSSLGVDDATARTQILEGVSAAFSHQNRARAVFLGKKKELGAKEGRAEFAAQFRLFGQAVTSAVALCDTPEKCDEQLSKLLLSLEELEGRFGEFDEFLGELAQKREEVNDAIGAKRQQLLDERHRRAQNLMTAAERILQGIGRRAQTFKTPDDLNAYFASDAMVLKLADVQSQLAALGDGVRADEVASRIKSARQDALRQLRDKTELGGGSENTVKLGHHEFSVHTQPLELVLVPREGVMHLHLGGTDFFEPVADPVLEASRDLWDQTLPSETSDVYRGEFLAASMLLDAEDGRGGLSIEKLIDATRTPSGLIDAVRAYAQDRLDEGYERGIHDADAAAILEKLVALRTSAGLLRFAADARAIAALWLAARKSEERRVLHARTRAVGRLRDETSYAAAQAALAVELEAPIAEHAKSLGVDASRGTITSAARYLVLELGAERFRLVASATADSLRRGLLSFLDENGSRRAFEDEMKALDEHPGERLAVARAYAEAFVQNKAIEHARPFVLEAAVMLVTDRELEREPSAATVETQVEGLLGAHGRIQNRTMRLAIDELLSRLTPFVTEAAPRFRAFRKAKAEIVEREKQRLRMSEFVPRVLTSFVRNQLIDKVYLPLIGANLAKQIGALGAKKRTDLMGMLLLVSPPGYGKTTLMEYVASKLGLVFMKVNGPALGHEVTSLDPAEARSGTAKQEVEKINLALEMGNNVMLYLDDIQHTSPELLQKFISLCDGQRRIEGVWRGRTRTYDLRGKKFCVVMAGNPYTESGARFQIPDMLSNRADTYNLGDILGGQEDLFASSYVENSLTSNSALAPLATREPADVHKLVRMARGEDVPLTDLAHGYSAAEVDEILGVLRHLLRVQSVLLRVNEEYIRSASQEDAYRTEPPFKLQGSYRNMNKLAEKVVAAMNEDEIEQLVDDHYTSESQTLTTGAEQNLLKLAELRGRMSEEQKARWKDIKDTYLRTRKAGGKGDDPVARVTGALSGLDEQLQKIGEALAAASGPTKLAVTLDSAAASESGAALAEVVREHASAMSRIVQSLVELARRPAPAPAAPSVADDRPTNPGFPPPPRVPSVPPAARKTTPPPPGTMLDLKVEELMALVKRLDQRLSSFAPSAPRFDVVLDASSASTFYRSMDGDDVVRHGGVFVATYAKLPALGSFVVLGIELPGGVRTEARAQVAWLQEHLSDDTPAGFGARLVDPSPDLSAMIVQFTRYREPLVRE